MLVHYLVIALPLYQYLMQKQYEANGEIYHISDVLFEINGKPMTNNALGRRLALYCKIHFHNSLNTICQRFPAGTRAVGDSAHADCGHRDRPEVQIPSGTIDGRGSRRCFGLKFENTMSIDPTKISP